MWNAGGRCKRAGEGTGPISQARLGPGRIHHCMRSIGMVERAHDLMCERALDRVTFGEPIAEWADIQDWIAEARIELEMVRAAYDEDGLADGHGRQSARPYRDRRDQGWRGRRWR